MWFPEPILSFSVYPSKNRKMKFLFFILLSGYLLTCCSTYRLITCNFPGSGDQYIFPCVSFPASSSPLPIPTSYSASHFSREFRHFLQKHHTLAFLMIQDDTIRIEYYAPHLSPDQNIDLFSISKSVVASVTGIAYEEGYLSSLSDTLGQYLKNLPPRYNCISIDNLLNMRSGIHNSMYYTIRLYYSHNLPGTLSRIPLHLSPGGTYEYNNAATQWLVTLIEQVTKRHFADYFYQKLWLSLGMEDTGNWTIDSRRQKNIRGFCGLNLSARDLGKLGLCYLHNGYYAGKQIIPSAWLDSTFHCPASVTPTPEDPVYHMHWHIFVPDEEILAKGLLGQYLYLNKKTNTIIIRLGTRESSVEWLPFFRKLMASPHTATDFFPKNNWHRL